MGEEGREDARLLTGITAYSATNTNSIHYGTKQ